MKEEISVRWLNCRGVVTLENGEKVAVRAKKATGKVLTLEGEQVLPKNAVCKVSLNLPPLEPGPPRVAHARCRIRDSILSASRYVCLVDILAFPEGEQPW